MPKRLVVGKRERAAMAKPQRLRQVLLFRGESRLQRRRRDMKNYAVYFVITR